LISINLSILLDSDQLIIKIALHIPFKEALNDLIVLNKHYWLLLFAGLIIFSVLVWLEHKQNSNIELQTQKAYKETQRIINEKELTFVKITTKLIPDSLTLQRNWSSIIETAHDENIIIQVYKNDTLLVWSSNEIETKQCLTEFKTGSSFYQGINGNYLAYKNINGSYTYVLLYEINSTYAFKNQYINNHFNKELSYIKDGFVLPKSVEKFTDIKDITGNYLFSIQIFTSTEKMNLAISICLSIIILFILFLIHMIARNYIQKHFWQTTVTFFAAFFIIRWVNIYYQIPVFIYEIKLFDSSIYASSEWFPSLGDLLIDSIIVFWYLIILENLSKKRLSKKKAIQWVWAKFIILLLLSLSSAHLAFSSIKSLTIDSQISFNVNNFSSINQFSLVGIIIAIILLLSIYFICRNFVRVAQSEKDKFLIQMILAGIIITCIYITFAKFYFKTESYQLFLTTSVIAAFILFKLFVKKLNRFPQYFVVSFIVSVFAALTITHWVNIKERDNRKLFAGKLVTQNDITTDYFLRTIEKKIADDKNITDYFLYFFTKSKFEKRIKQLYFTGYLSRFEVSVFDYDTLGFDLKQKNAYSYAQINKTYQNQTLETIDNYFRYINGNSSLKGYLAKFAIQKNGKHVGYLFILLQPKLIQDENRFDELLIEGFRQNKKKIFDYSYAVYKDKHLIFQSGEYPYRITNTWGEARDTFRFFTENNFDHLLYTDSQPLTIAVSKPADSAVQGIALFSFIFTFCTLILIFVLFVYIGINAKFFRKNKLFESAFSKKLKTLFNRFLLVENPDILYIRTRIQTSIIFIVFITLSSTSYFTVSFITQKYNSRQTERLMKKLRNVVITIENENITEMDDKSSGELEAFINQIADVYDTDVTLYDVNGKIMASSIGKIYDEGIVSELMNPGAFFHLNFLKESQFSQNEHIASLDFQTAYSPVFRKKSELVGYLQLPYFSQKSDLLNEISSIIIGFINLYVLLFIIIGIIAYLVSRNISYPLILIQQKLSKTILGNKNEPINWHRDDEIGELVKQYNSMILQLEESAKKLAETEREGAWREIARQIAHEIKNPLTPMKLSIQHLQRAFKNNDANLEDKINKTTNLLVSQIDTLSELATEFSSYAKMPAPTYERFNVKNILDQIVELYNTDTSILLVCDEHIEINFDRSYLSRSIGNIVKNAIQSIPEGNEGKVEILVSEDNENIHITVKDNGSGINAEQAGKIFMPYFSTKVSGMGLGLPLVKNMIESGGGKISFKTLMNIGTEFYISLPKNTT